jgi:hypothetical protein
MFNAEMSLNRADALQRMIDFFAVAGVVFDRGLYFLKACLDVPEF